MSFLHEIEKIQVGVDLATSITILAAGATWWVNKRNERKLGVIDSAKSTIIESINNAINETAKSFNEFVNFTIVIEKKIDACWGNVSESGLDKMADAIKSHKLDAEDLIKSFNESLAAMGSFYERCSTLRYTIYPSLYSLGDEMESVKLIEKEIDDVLVHYNTGQCYLSYSRELLSLINKVKISLESEPRDEVAQSISKEYSREILSICLDKDYIDLLLDFIPTKYEEALRLSLSKDISERNDDDRSVQLYMANIFIESLAKNPEKIIAQFLVNLRIKMQENRMQCKEFLVSLCAISSKMQQQSKDFSISKAFQDLKGDDYFSTKKTIR